MINRRRLVAITPGILGLLTVGSFRAVCAASPAPGRQTYFFLVFTDPVAGQEEAYARWFNEPHLHEMSQLPSVVAAQRYTDSGVELRRAPTKTPRDLVLYTIETDSPDDLKGIIAHRTDAGKTWPGPAIASLKTATYRAIQRQLTGVGGEPANAVSGDPATFLVLAFLDAVPGQDDAFTTWYDTIHEPELLANRGVASGQRAVLSEVQMGPADIQSRYLMQLTLVTRDLPAVFRGMLASGGPPSPALDRTRGFGYTYRAI